VTTKRTALIFERACVN